MCAGDPAGRRYAVAITATDACGNESEPVVIGFIYVPHDQSPSRKDCLKTTKVGVKLKDSLFGE